MKHLFCALAFYTLSANASDGPKILSGSISGSYPEAEYTVSGSAVVPPGKTLSFEAGSVLRFESFSGITVRGTLVCKGTPGRPVIFTSINDSRNSGTGPEPFDWNGIKAAPEASGVTLEHCVVTYSTFGITIESVSTSATITNVSFHHNGSASLTRGKKMMPVNENIPVSFSWQETAPPRPAGESRSAWRKPARFAGAGAGIAGAALWLTGHLCAEHFNSLIKPGVLLSTAEEYKDSRNGWVAARNAGMAIFGSGAAAFSVTLFF